MLTVAKTTANKTAFTVLQIDFELTAKLEATGLIAIKPSASKLESAKEESAKPEGLP